MVRKTASLIVFKVSPIVCKLTAFGKADLNLFKRRWQYILARVLSHKQPWEGYPSLHGTWWINIKNIYVSVKLNVHSLYSMAIFLPLLIRGLVFPHTKFLLRKTKYTPKKKTNARYFGTSMVFFLTKWLIFFFDRETRFRPRCWIDIHRSLANNILPSHFSEESAYFGEK